MSSTNAVLLFLLALHSAAAVVTLISAFREGLGWRSSLNWGGVGFVTGFLGLITRARTGRRNVHHVQIVQDAFLNFGLEFLALFVLPFFFR